MRLTSFTTSLISLGAIALLAACSGADDSDGHDTARDGTHADSSPDTDQPSDGADADGPDSDTLPVTSDDADPKPGMVQQEPGDSEPPGASEPDISDGLPLAPSDSEPGDGLDPQHEPDTATSGLAPADGEPEPGIAIEEPGGPEIFACGEPETTLIDLDEEGAGGITPQSLLDLAEGEHVTELIWADGTTTELAVAVDYEDAQAMSVGFVLPEPATNEPMIELEQVACPGYVAVPVNVSITSDDGQLAESLTVELRSEGASGYAEQKLDPDSIEGEFELATHLDADGDMDTMSVQLRFEEGQLTGHIVVTMRTSSGEGPDATVAISQHVVAEF